MDTLLTVYGHHIAAGLLVLSLIVAAVIIPVMRIRQHEPPELSPEQQRDLGRAKLARNFLPVLKTMDQLFSGEIASRSRAGRRS